MKMWIAKHERQPYLVLFKEKPVKRFDKFTRGWWWESENMCNTYMILDSSEYPEVTFENSPQQVEIKLVKNVKHSVEYVEFEGVVKYIYKHRYLDRKYSVLGDIKFFKDGYVRDFALKPGIFTKTTAPKVGDRVVLRYRKTKKRAKGDEYFDFMNSKIIKVL